MEGAAAEVGAEADVGQRQGSRQGRTAQALHQSGRGTPLEWSCPLNFQDAAANGRCAPQGMGELTQMHHDGGQCSDQAPRAALP